MLDFTRQQSLINQDLVSKVCVTLIGAGAVGSFTALALSKMGVEKLQIFDDDVVTPHNLPNQFYRGGDVARFKVDSLREILQDFAAVDARILAAKFIGGTVGSIIVVTADNMTARKLAWEAFKSAGSCVGFIDARMGGELAIVYCIRKSPKWHQHFNPVTEWILKEEDREFYEANLFPDEEMEPIRCTAKAIIYNVLAVSSLVCRAFKSLIEKEYTYARESVFDMKNMIFMEQK